MKPELEKSLADSLSAASKAHPGHILVMLVIGQGSGEVEIVTNVALSEAQNIVSEVGRHLSIKNKIIRLT